MKKPLVKNIGLKITAVLCALLFWFLILGLQTTPQELGEPIEIKPFNLSDQWVVDVLPKAYVTIQTDKDTARTIRPEDLEAYVDLKNAALGNYTSPVFVTSKNPKVIVVSVRPDTVSMHIETKLVKDVPIEAVITGHPHDGFSITQVTLTANSGTVTGPASRVAQIRKIKAVWNLTGNESETKIMSGAKFRDQDDRELESVRIDPDKIEATIVVEAAQRTKVLPIHPQFTNTLKSGYIKAITVRPQLVEVTGETKTLDQLTEMKTEPIDLEKITKSGTYIITLQSVKDAVVHPNKVDVQIEIGDLHPAAPEVDKPSIVR